MIKLRERFQKVNNNIFILFTFIIIEFCKVQITELLGILIIKH